jgi:hypothetical protein
MLVRKTFAAGTAAPLGSLMCPVISPNVCANSELATAANTAADHTMRLNPGCIIYLHGFGFPAPPAYTGGGI